MRMHMHVSVSHLCDTRVHVVCVWGGTCHICVMCACACSVCVGASHLCDVCMCV